MNRTIPFFKLLALLTALTMLWGCTGPGPAETLPGTTAASAQYTVTFLAPDGSVLYTDSVAAGTAAQPPINPILPYGYVFSHWDTDFSNVTEDLRVTAVCREVGTADNVISCSGGYVRQGQRTTVSLKLGGTVCLCAFNLRIVYDTEKLDFVELRGQDPMLDGNCIEEEGVIYLNFVSSSNTLGDVDLTDLVFAATGDVGQADITIEVIELIAYDESFEFIEPPYTLIPATITVAPA